jgi:hypothetical protein
VTRFYGFTNLRNPGLHVWRDAPSGPTLRMYLRPVGPPVND